MNKITIDIGYSSSKILFNGEFYKVPTAISFAADTGIEFGESIVYEFEGDKYYVGEQAGNDEAFVTTDYKFLNKFAPLIVYHIFKKLGIAGDINLITGLALTDWGKRSEFTERLQFLKVNDETVATNVEVVGPQGSGSYAAYIAQENLQNDIPKTMCVIDIGFRTINFLYYENGNVQQSKLKGFSGHGVVSIIKPFTNYLESTYGLPFSEQEALKIFMENEFYMGGIVQEAIPVKIAELKNQFIQKLLSSILISEKKLLMTSQKVLMCGGGAYFIRDVQLPPNVVYNTEPLEFSNVLGFSLMGKG
ncbi:MAG: hypothetical protein DRG78_09315 [Epsilonproteobacteria bacterium]|nr:MAG: hypothetical protein DRG78_09315 [Campylobacterota bacterium]